MLKVVAQTKDGKLILVTVVNHPKPGGTETCSTVVTTVSGSIVKCPNCGVFIQPELSIDNTEATGPEMFISLNIIQPLSTQYVEFYIDHLSGEVGLTRGAEDANRKIN